jgi:hypothetical protein
LRKIPKMLKWKCVSHFLMTSSIWWNHFYLFWKHSFDSIVINHFLMHAASISWNKTKKVSFIRDDFLRSISVFFHILDFQFCWKTSAYQNICSYTLQAQTCPILMNWSF